MRPEVRISEQLTEDAARLLADAAERGGHLVITGGSTPKAAYHRVKELGADWSGADIWFSDAGCVAPDPELGIKDRNGAGVEHPGMAPLVPRITLTLPVLNAGARVVFLVSGEEKAEAVARAFNGRPNPDAPSSLLEPRGEFVLLCDPPAAAHL